MGNLAKAKHIFYKIPPFVNKQKNPDFLKARLLLARLYYNQKKYNLAQKECLTILKYFPNHKETKSLLHEIQNLNQPVIIQFFKDTYKYLPALLKGTLMTLILVLFTMLVSPFGGLLIALGRISRFYPLSSLCWCIIWLFRGTPLLLQLFFIYYGLPALGITLKPLTAAFLGLGLNYSAYLAEIIRAGIQSIDAGQMEAALALGMTYSQAMRRIIIPQTYKRIIPPIANEFIALIKDTALVSTIAMVELMRSADQLFNTYFDVKILILAGLIYLILTSIFTLIFEKVERKVGAYEQK
ncbi:MAG: amino acid ABC transporter permease [Desulfonauticus sp.]|nr:amino acid ABC transporter permease [Desulfonauticus sp.]